MTTICIPNDANAHLIEPLPEGVRVVRWSVGQPPPPELADVRFYLRQFGPAPAAELRDTFGRMPKLEVVQLLSAGVDTILPSVPLGVTLCDGRGIHGDSTSEWVLMAILASLRELPRLVLASREHRWEPQVTGDLAGARVLVIGAGDVGERVARRLRAFEADPVLVGRSPREGVHGASEIASLLPDADVVVLVLPMTSQTRGMVDAGFLARMKDGSLLVNGARGPVVVTDDLVAALRSGRIRAAVDVTDPEPLPADSPLWDLPNCLVTPHIAGAVRAFPERGYQLVREQVSRFATGEPLINVVAGEY